MVYETVDIEVNRLFPSRELTFRRLIFERTESLVQSEALLIKEGSSHEVNQIERKKSSSSSKSKRKGAHKRTGNDACLRCDCFYSSYFFVAWFL